MALINCPECKKRISDTVTACPQCGYAITPEALTLSRKKGIGKIFGIGFIIAILVVLGFVLYFYETWAMLEFGNKCKNNTIVNITETFKSSDNFYFSLSTLKPIGTTKINIRLSEIDKQKMMLAPYKTYPMDINPDWCNVQLSKGNIFVDDFFLYRKGKINVAFVANDKLIAQKEITIK